MADDDQGQGQARGLASQRMSEARASYTRWRRIRLSLYAVLALFCLVFVGPPVVDFGKGLIASDGECRLVRVVAGDQFRVRCPVIGGQDVQLLGADVPRTREVECFSEFVAGYRAMWAARWALWTAGSITANSDGFGWSDRTLVTLKADGVGMARILVEGGYGRWDDGYGDAGWCHGQQAQLDG